MKNIFIIILFLHHPNNYPGVTFTRGRRFGWTFLYISNEGGCVAQGGQCTCRFDKKEFCF